jgi:integrase
MIDIPTTRMSVPERYKPRVRRVSPINTRRGAEQYERQVRQELLDGTFEREEKEVPTFNDWFEGRFWREWVITEGNKPSEQESKKSIFDCHLTARFGRLRLDEIIRDGHIPDFRATLVERSNKGKISRKRINNILAVLSKALHYAEDQGVIDSVPKIGIFKLESPESEWWSFLEYSRLLAASKADDPNWYAAICLAGEAGLRVGEVRALVWERDLDLVSETITVNEQIRKGVAGTPKSGKRRKVPMTSTLIQALKGLPVVGRGPVVRNHEGQQLRDGQTTHAIYRLCRKAGLPENAWHCLRHSFGTHAAILGVNPWKLQTWMGHKSIKTTMGYVHVAEEHQSTIPEEVLAAGDGEPDPDRRIIRMLGGRRRVNGTSKAPAGLAEDVSEAKEA